MIDCPARRCQAARRTLLSEATKSAILAGGAMRFYGLT
jgi:hypothetical protein